ncbi:MAG: hypothetical protein VB131_04545 [Burkholderia gladioli]
MSQQSEVARAFLFSITPIVLSAAWFLSGSDALAVAIQVFAWLIVGCIAVVAFCMRGSLPKVSPLPRSIEVLRLISVIVMMAALFMMHAVVALLMLVAACVAARILRSASRASRQGQGRNGDSDFRLDCGSGLRVDPPPENTAVATTGS